MRVIRLFVVFAIFLFLSPAEVLAQYFGRNKVEYLDFDFRILATEHFDIYYYSGEEPAARLAARLAERWYARFSQLLDHRFDRRQPLVLYGSQAEFAQTNVVSELLSDTVGGVTEGAKRRIAMPFAPTLAETNRVLGHEIAHAFQFDLERRHGAWRHPLWFVEGMAEFLARGHADAEATVWLRDAVASGRLPERERDAARRLSPYQYGHAFWSYLASRFGDDVVRRALKPEKRGKLEDQMRRATGIELDTLYADWRAGLMSTETESERSTRSEGRSLVEARDGFGRMQLGPSLSPDGRYAVFFSERDRLSLDLFLADLDTGRIVRKLATTTASARFDSLQPLRSSGAWSPDGKRFAFPAVRRGRAALLLLDLDTGREREIAFGGLGQILSPAWAPDGRAIAFSALAGGFTDLYLYDLNAEKLRQLTNDPFADLHPAWSPSGDRLAFATERYSSDMAALTFRPTTLAIFDLASGAIEPIASAHCAHTNPQWSADGRLLYFVANPGGVSNVYRFDLEELATYQVTNVDTGVGGLAPTSPAISLAGQAPVLAYTVYKNGRHQLQILDDLLAVADERYSKREPTVIATPEPGTIGAVLADSKTGLPDPQTIVAREYQPRLSLERIGQPYVSTGGGAFGTFVRGGGSLLFGDMLRERQFGAAVQIGNRLQDAGFEARFLNRVHRWNWGAIAELEPALRRHRRSETVVHDGQDAILSEADYLQRVQLRAAGLIAYPFSRGLRIEFTGGVRYAAYHREVRSQVVAVSSGRVLEAERIQTSGGVPTTVGEIGTALVGDTSVFGPTAPLLGSRYRFEVAPAIGSLSYTRVLMDYRQYLMPVRPYTLAMRLLHSGRYGRDGDDPRLLSTFLGSQYFVRGHRFDSRRCRPTLERGCDDELRGNQILVGNVELRFPLAGVLSRQIDYRFIPADAFVFADAGVVWSGARSLLTPELAAENRQLGYRRIISSIGGGLRLNAGGLPVELAVLRAMDGPAPGWTFDLGFRVGF